MGEPIRLAIAGLGLVGKRHADAIRQVEGVDLAAVIDLAAEAKQFAGEQGIACYGNLAEIFAADRPDGIILSTPTLLHAGQGLECIAQKCPVLIEKPLAATVSEAEQIATAGSRANVPVLVGHHRRHNPIIQKAKEIIGSGAIGQIRTVQATCWFYKPDSYFEEAPWRTQKGAGPISVNLVHDVDLIRHLCGEIVSVQAQAAPSSRGYENEEAAAAVVRFASGAVGTISVADGVVSPWSWELTAREYPVYPATSESCYMLGGTEGALSIPDLKVWRHAGAPDWWSPISATNSPLAAADPLVNQIAHFARVIRDGEAPLVSGAEGLKTMRVVGAIQEAAESGETVHIMQESETAQ
ncbi:Gfo/Idh/MocA family oxidoreductase [Alphaproteobacteria bacterium]|nr:Gfo/Idh/MocA family oxidoreductase [Alphaproteobacteria bacterium]